MQRLGKVDGGNLALSKALIIQVTVVEGSFRTLDSSRESLMGLVRVLGIRGLFSRTYTLNAEP